MVLGMALLDQCLAGISGDSADNLAALPRTAPGFSAGRQTPRNVRRSPDARVAVQDVHAACPPGCQLCGDLKAAGPDCDAGRRRNPAEVSDMEGVAMRLQRGGVAPFLLNDQPPGLSDRTMHGVGNAAGFRLRGFGQGLNRPPGPGLPFSRQVDDRKDGDRSSGCNAHALPRMKSAARSAIITTGEAVLPETMRGMTDASTIRSPAMP